MMPSMMYLHSVWLRSFFASQLCCSLLWVLQLCCLPCASFINMWTLSLICFCAVFRHSWSLCSSKCFSLWLVIDDAWCVPFFIDLSSSWQGRCLCRCHPPFRGACPHHVQCSVSSMLMSVLLLLWFIFTLSIVGTYSSSSSEEWALLDIVENKNWSEIYAFVWGWLVQ